LSVAPKEKTDALKQVIKEHGFDALLVGIRRDEHGVRNKERYMSPRDKEFRWNVAKEKAGGDSGMQSMQDTELAGWGLYATKFKDADHVRVHPILHWTELDIWEYVEKENLPVNPLYFSKDGKRYRSLGCVPCTQPTESKADTIKKIIEEIKTSKESERGGRSQDKEEAHAMEKLRSLGYM
jgi:sulfate adenylyltransferase subunit 2